MKNIVCKFGGTSMATAQVIRQCAEIIKSDSQRKFIVVSAPGKRFSGDAKITDLLYAAYAEKATSVSSLKSLAIIKERFIEIEKDLGLDIGIGAEIDEIEKNIFSSTSADYAASRGEYLSARLVAAFLGFRFVDAADIIKFRSDGSFDGETTNDLVARYKDEECGIVVPGFYGRLPDKTIKTFTRGGSDFTGAIIARGVGADIYENWTDVDGFMVTDPRIVKDPKLIEALSYDELRELSYMGASVLHPDSIFPVQYDRIPINIKNTFNPGFKGTLILSDTEGYNLPTVTGIAGRKGNTTVQMKKAMMNNEVGFCRKVLSVLERHGVSVEHIPTGIDTMSVVISESGLNGADENKLIEEIRGAVNPDRIELVHNLALIAIVGHGMANTPGTAAKVFGALYGSGVNVKMIDQGSSELNIIVGVDEKDYETSISAIYRAFFG